MYGQKHKEFGLEWTERYSVYRTIFAGWVSIQIYYEDGAFHVKVADAKLKRTFPDWKLGAKAALLFIRESVSSAFKKVEGL